MITAVDTNVLLDVLRPNPEFVEASKSALAQAEETGSLVISPLVYAELGAHFLGLVLAFPGQRAEVGAQGLRSSVKELATVAGFLSEPREHGRNS